MSSFRMGSAARSMAAVRISAAAAKMVRVVPIVFFMSSSACMPVYFPTRMVLPRVRPVIMLVMICVTWVPVDTAATLSGEQYLPMTNRSTAPYSAWMRFAAMKGRENVNSMRNTFPLVRLFSVIVFSLCIFWLLIVCLVVDCDL